ncbi:FecR protein [Daejeonella rubra]|uniref:FecR protein n=1 Tax=Daejeonella rubra TaxID=990371 RepID=A0A1G9TSK1_9SPHI|nr:FecR family protein [Daejeonella rubra]SDM50581.1 FecR protein [Daejeonella rubra]
MEEKHFSDLIAKYLSGNASEAEISLVEEYYKRLEARGANVQNSHFDFTLREEMLNKIREQIERPVVELNTGSNKRYRRYFAVAASILIILSSGLYFYKNRTQAPALSIQNSPVKINDVAPGGNKAVLTLADGSRISLDDAQQGEIAVQSGISIIKKIEGQLIYERADTEFRVLKSQDIYNKIETPKGGQYQVNLPDGSKVWLNAASSLRYPAVFSGTERKVELTGEAYFEISPNKLMPFKVVSASQVVEVLGTHFNVNAYSNESQIKTTLIEGSVKVSESSINKVSYLKPGEEALNKKGEILVHSANVEQVMAWKNGNFQFNDMYLVDIMRQLERWYDVEIDYSAIPHTRYNAYMSRNLHLSRVLEILEVTGRVKFSIEGKTIKISKNK